MYSYSDNGMLLFLIIVIGLIAFIFIVGKKQEEKRQQEIKERERKILDEARNLLEEKKLLYIGKIVNNRNDALFIMEDFLEPIGNIGREGLVIICLDSLNNVAGIDIRIGEACSVQGTPSEIINFALNNNSKKIVVGHNHTTSFFARRTVVPSDADVSHCASLYQLSKGFGIVVLDDLVLCGNELKSILNTLRFKQMIREY